MAIADPDPIINGFVYGYSSVEVQFGGWVFRGIKSIDYKHKRTPGKIRGTHPQILGRTRGQYEAEGSLTMWKHAWDKLRDALGEGYMEFTFPICVTYSERGPLNPTVDILYGCQIIEVDNSHSEGSDGLEVKLSLDIFMILENGLPPMANMLGV